MDCKNAHWTTLKAISDKVTEIIRESDRLLLLSVQTGKLLKVGLAKTTGDFAVIIAFEVRNRLRSLQEMPTRETDSDILERPCQAAGLGQDVGWSKSPADG